MKYTVKDILSGLIKTIILLVFLEVVTTALLPALGMSGFKPAFNVLVVLFLAFKLDTPLLPFLILVIQYTHSIFSIEGWAAGTFTGIFISISVRYVKDQLNFSSAISTTIVVQIFQLLWILCISTMFALKIGNFSNFLPMIFDYIPESLFLSLISHFFFSLLDNFWQVDRRSSGVAY
jgi:hypothetical protein